MVVVRVTPVHGAGAVVQSQAVGPQHVGGDEDAAVGPVHPGSLDAADAVVDLVLLPVRPVHPAVGTDDTRHRVITGELKCECMNCKNTSTNDAKLSTQ